MQLRNKMRTDDDEAARKACYEGLRSIGPFVAGAAPPARAGGVWRHATPAAPAANAAAGAWQCLASPAVRLAVLACYLAASQGARRRPAARCLSRPGSADKFAEIVRTRQRLAKAAGYENYYAMKFEQAEGFTLRVGAGRAGHARWAARVRQAVG